MNHLGEAEADTARSGYLKLLETQRKLVLNALFGIGLFLESFTSFSKLRPQKKDAGSPEMSGQKAASVHQEVPPPN